MDKNLRRLNIRRKFEQHPPRGKKWEERDNSDSRVFFLISVADFFFFTLKTDCLIRTPMSVYESSV